MNCLDCATMIPQAPMARTAVSCCVYCGAGICLDHARFVMPYGRPVGVVPPQGARRMLCTSCDAAAGLRGEMVTGRAVRADGRGRVSRRGLAVPMLGRAARFLRMRRGASPGPPSADVPSAAAWPGEPPYPDLTSAGGSA